METVGIVFLIIGIVISMGNAIITLVDKNYIALAGWVCLTMFAISALLYSLE